MDYETRLKMRRYHFGGVHVDAVPDESVRDSGVPRGRCVREADHETALPNGKLLRRRFDVLSLFRNGL